MSNMISGVLLTYMRPFRPGDIVKTSDTFGEVVEKNLLVTRIRTLKYELNVYIDKINAMPRIYSELHQLIQDKFNDAKVEIMSPQYTSLRDGEKIAIPEEYLS